MKKLLALMIVMLTSIDYVIAQEPKDILYIKGVIDKTGNGHIDFELTNPITDYMGFQILLQLPEDISCVKDEEEEYIVEYGERFNSLSEKAKNRFGLQLAKTNKGYQIVCLNTNGKAIPEKSGKLMSIPVKSSSATPYSQVLATVAEIEFTDLNATAFRPTETTHDFVINGDTKAVVIASTVGITSVTNRVEVKGKIYNLKGQLMEMPHKGIFLQNGKKVVVK